MTVLSPMSDDLCNCEGMKELLKEGKIRFRGSACWCSPIERHYEIEVNGEWLPTETCPFGGHSIPVQLETFRVQFPVRFEEVRVLM
jgi:hypothetical protein